MAIGRNKKAGEVSWFTDWFRENNIPKMSAHRIWNGARDAGAVRGVPSLASERDQQAFAQWIFDEHEKKKAAKAANKADARARLAASHDKTCQYCGMAFTSKRSDAKFCRTPCRVTAYRNTLK